MFRWKFSPPNAAAATNSNQGENIGAVESFNLESAYCFGAEIFLQVGRSRDSTEN